MTDLDHDVFVAWADRPWWWCVCDVGWLGRRLRYGWWVFPAVRCPLRRSDHRTTLDYRSHTDPDDSLWYKQKNRNNITTIITIIRIRIIIRTIMFIVLSSWQATLRVHPVHMMNVENQFISVQQGHFCLPNPIVKAVTNVLTPWALLNSYKSQMSVGCEFQAAGPETAKLHDQISWKSWEWETVRNSQVMTWARA